MASDYELNRVCAEAYWEYFDKHREEIDFDSLTIERISLSGIEVYLEPGIAEVKTLGVLVGGISPAFPNHTISPVIVGNACYDFKAGWFKVKTKWDFTNNKQLYADDFAEMMFRDLEEYLYKHFATARETEE